MKLRPFDREKLESGLLEKLLAAHRGEPDAVPEGHKTRAEWAKEWGKHDEKARELINAGLKAGLMGKSFHRVLVGKLIRKTEHYFEIVPRKRKPAELRMQAEARRV